MTLGQALGQACARGLTRLDAQLLLLQALGRGASERAWLLTHDQDPIEATAQAQFEALCERRRAGEPVAYLLGRREFMGLELAVDARVLVPRPDTETLVEWALALMTDRRSPRILDLGTGSGAIALALAHQRPDAQVQGVDRSAPALAVARANGERLGLAVQWRQACWLEGSQTGWDLIVSNPPYIPEGDPHLPALAHEPTSALVAGPEGLDDLHHLIAAAPPYLASGGWLLLEHGWNQSEAVRQALVRAGFCEVQSRKDLAGHTRCSGGRWNPAPADVRASPLHQQGPGQQG